MVFSHAIWNVHVFYNDATSKTGGEFLRSKLVDRFSNILTTPSSINVTVCLQMWKLSNRIITTLITKLMSFKMRSAMLTYILSFTVATGVVNRLFFWYAGSNNCISKRSSSGVDLDSVK